MDWKSLFDFRQTAQLQLIGFMIEWVVLTQILKRTYPKKQALLSLLIAIPAFVIWGVETQGVFILEQMLRPYRLTNWNVPPGWRLAISFLIVEFHFYFVHRLEHRINWMWADHQVHHSSQDLNIFDGNRLGWTVIFSGGYNVFFLPLTFFGFSCNELIGLSGMVLFYQFFIHTQTIPKLGFLDRVLNTPSNHRVHHACNLEYLDCNYGGITVIFDHIFGTYVPESDAITTKYGLIERDGKRTTMLGLVFGGWRDIFRMLGKCQSARERIQVLFGPPGWSPDGSTLTTAQLREQQKSEVRKAS